MKSTLQLCRLFVLRTDLRSREDENLSRSTDLVPGRRRGSKSEDFATAEEIRGVDGDRVERRRKRTLKRRSNGGIIAGPVASILKEAASTKRVGH